MGRFDGGCPAGWRLAQAARNLVSEELNGGFAVGPGSLPVRVVARQVEARDACYRHSRPAAYISQPVGVAPRERWLAIDEAGAPSTIFGARGRSTTVRLIFLPALGGICPVMQGGYLEIFVRQ